MSSVLISFLTIVKVSSNQWWHFAAWRRWWNTPHLGLEVRCWIEATEDWNSDKLRGLFQRWTDRRCWMWRNYSSVQTWQRREETRGRRRWGTRWVLKAITEHSVALKRWKWSWSRHYQGQLQQAFFPQTVPTRHPQRRNMFQSKKMRKTVATRQQLFLVVWLLTIVRLTTTFRVSTAPYLHRFFDQGGSGLPRSNNCHVTTDHVALCRATFSFSNVESMEGSEEALHVLIVCAATREAQGIIEHFGLQPDESFADHPWFRDFLEQEIFLHMLKLLVTLPCRKVECFLNLRLWAQRATDHWRRWHFWLQEYWNTMWLLQLLWFSFTLGRSTLICWSTLDVQDVTVLPVLFG